MPTFAYRALQANGKIAEGAIDAAGRPDALRQIAALGLRPVNVTEKAGAAKKNTGESPGHFSFKFESKRVSAKELENFTRLLSSLLAAGVPLSRALVILQKEASSAASKAQWKSIHDQVVDGLSLADAMAKSPETFPRVYVAMVEADFKINWRISSSVSIHSKIACRPKKPVLRHSRQPTALNSVCSGPMPSLALNCCAVGDRSGCLQWVHSTRTRR